MGCCMSLLNPPTAAASAQEKAYASEGWSDDDSSGADSPMGEEVVELMPDAAPDAKGRGRPRRVRNRRRERRARKQAQGRQPASTGGGAWGSRRGGALAGTGRSGASGGRQQPAAKKPAAQPSAWNTGNAAQHLASTWGAGKAGEHAPGGPNEDAKQEEQAPADAQPEAALPAPASGPDTCAAFFFPVDNLPCRYWLDGRRCHRRNCQYMHTASSLTALISFLESAEQTMDICVYIINCRPIVDTILDAHANGVRVRIITDDDQAKKQSFAVGADPQKANGNRNHLNRLASAGIDIRTDASRHHMHNKFCVIDDQLLITGSFNWTMGAVLKNQENIVVVGAGAGPAASRVIPLYKQEFLRLWHTFGKRNAGSFRHNPATVERTLVPLSSMTAGQRYDCLFFPDKNMPCRNFARDRCRRGKNCTYAHEDSALNRLVHYIDSAQKSLLVCVLTITCDEISDAILRAHKREGVSVRVISDDGEAIRSGSDVVKLDKAGVPVLTDRSGCHMHNKFVVIDGSMVITGSFNWTKSAVVGNQENLLMLEGAAGKSRAFGGRRVELAQLFTDQFNKMWTQYEASGNTVEVTSKLAAEREAQRGNQWR